jgi:arylsulfatase A-like enzyme
MTSVALIVLDTLRKDVFDEFFNWLPGIRFDNAWTTGHYTIPAHASLFTGHYPSSIGVHSKSESLDCDHKPIAKRLQVKGYSTRAISENILASPINNFDRGFDRFDCIGPAKVVRDEIFNWSQAAKESRYSGLGRDLRLMLKCVKSDSKTIASLRHGWQLKMKESANPEEMVSMVRSANFAEDEFLFLNLMDAHGPYNPPDEHIEQSARTSGSISDCIERAEKSQLQPQREAYDSCARYLSKKYKEIYKKLREEFQYIITVSDHGELFGEHGFANHYVGVFPELVQVPVCLSGKTLDTKQDDRLVSLLDVHATIEDLTGVENMSCGYSLLDEPKRKFCRTEYIGLRSKYSARLKKKGIPKDRVTELNRPMFGIGFNDSYVYEDAKSEIKFVPETVSGDFVTRHQKMTEDIDIENYEDPSSTDYSPEIESQLEHLGYL